MTDQNPPRERSVQEIYLDEDGREQPNPVPLQPPVGYKKHPTIAEQMRNMIRMASLEASQMGAETEDEANDFDVGEDFEPNSPWENDFEMDPALEAMIALQSRPPLSQAPAGPAPAVSTQANPQPAPAPSAAPQSPSGMPSQ